MDIEAKKAALRQITKELQQFVGTYCGRPGERPNDFADEKCNDAALMLQEAMQNLDESG